MYCFTRSGLRKKSYSAAGSSSVEIQCRNVRWHFTSRDPVPGPVAADTHDLPRQDIGWLRSCLGIRYPARESIVLVLAHSGASLQEKIWRKRRNGRNSETIGMKEKSRSWSYALRCRGLYLHQSRWHMSRTRARGASHLYGEEAKELALAPVGLARHQTKWPCDQVGPPGPPPTGLRSPLDPGGEWWPIFRVYGLARAGGKVKKTHGTTALKKLETKLNPTM
jgi:hypothetical protein